jgi:hypothetical protein
MGEPMPEVIQSNNLDSAQTAFFARELEHIKARSYDVQYPEYKATKLIPVSTEAGPGAESITYQQFDSVGMAKVIADYADDLPRADVVGKEYTSRVRSIGGSYGYSVQEIRAAQMAGRPLVQRKANAARKAIEQVTDDLAWFGDETHGIKGLLTNPNITRVAADDTGEGGATEWSTKSATNILKDLNDLVNGMLALTNGIEVPDTLLLPIAQYSLINTLNAGLGNDTTVLQYFLRNQPSITRVEWVSKLATAGQGIEEDSISSGGPVAVLYRYSPDKLTLELPQPFEQFPAQERNLEFVVPCHARHGGVIVYYPLSISIMEGI